MVRYGATTDEWAHFARLVPEDLLPCVANPHAEISKASTLGALGKTPSLYNASRQVVGIKDWPTKRATAREIEQWSAEPDYSLCIQCRHWRAIDIDVDKPADAIRYAYEIMGLMPASALTDGAFFFFRRRSNSGRMLIPFIAPSGDSRFAKRVLRVPEGTIEILGDGQMFVACGTHTSGVRYEWKRAPIDLANLA